MAKNEVKRKDHLIDATGRIIVSCCSSVNKIVVNFFEPGPTLVARELLDNVIAKMFPNTQGE